MPPPSTGSKAWSPRSAISAASPPTRSSSTPAPCVRASLANTARLDVDAYQAGQRVVAWFTPGRLRGAGAMSARRIFARPARLAAIAPYLWMVLFFLVPFGFVLKISLSQTAIAQPPYVPVFDLGAGFRGDQGRVRGVVAGQFQAAGLRRSLCAVLSAQPRRGAGLDRDPARDRLSHRLRHGAAAAALAGRRDDAGDRAVLDLVPDPHLCLDQHPAA